MIALVGWRPFGRPAAQPAAWASISSGGGSARGSAQTGNPYTQERVDGE
jgi:hypothetical protein